MLLIISSNSKSIHLTTMPCSCPILDQTDSAVLPVIKQMESGQRQTRLDGFFMRKEDDIKFANVRSKRLREALNLSSMDKSVDTNNKRPKIN